MLADSLEHINIYIEISQFSISENNIYVPTIRPVFHITGQNTLFMGSISPCPLIDFMPQHPSLRPKNLVQ